MAKVAIYCRLSDEDRNKKNQADESESIQNQKSMLINYCIDKNWDVYNIYCDEDYSGVDRNRPEFNQMLEDCKNGFIDIVLCKTQSRFSRDMEIIEKYIHNKFLEWNIRFISIVDNADTKAIGNKKSRQINGLINEWYLEDISENIRKTLNHKKENGLYTGSFAPYGYLIDPQDKNHLVIDPIASKVVKSIFDMYLKGFGYLKIAKELNNKGVPNPTMYKIQNGSKYRNYYFEITKRGKLWTESTIYRILKREIYTGTLVQGFSENISYKNNKKRYFPEEKWIKCKNTHEPIISLEIWEKAKSIQKQKGRCDKFSGEVFSLSKKVFCLECGTRMWKMSYKLASGRYNYLKCKMVKISSDQCENKSSIRLDELEKIILNEINGLIGRFFNLDLITIDNGFKNKELIKALIYEKKNLKEQIKRKEFHLFKIYEDKLDGLIKQEQFEVYSKSFSHELKMNKNRIIQIDNQLKLLEDLNTDNFTKEKILNKYLYLSELNKIIVDEFIDSVYVGKIKADGTREIKINWKL